MNQQEHKARAEELLKISESESAELAAAQESGDWIDGRAAEPRMIASITHTLAAAELWPLFVRPDWPTPAKAVVDPRERQIAAYCDLLMELIRQTEGVTRAGLMDRLERVLAWRTKAGAP